MVTYLKNHVVGLRIFSVSVLRGKYLPGNEAERVEESLIQNVWRRGKFIVFELDSGFMLCHNAMSGFWDTADDPWTFDYVEGKRTATEKDVRVNIRLMKDGPSFLTSVKDLRFHDARLFGSLRFYPKLKSMNQIPSIANLGPDALITENSKQKEPLMQWNSMDLEQSCRSARTKVTIKELLMNQKHVAGIGNIYAAEALWQTRINPWKPSPDLTKLEVVSLTDAVMFVMKASIATAINYSEFLNVYRNKDCPRCGEKIEKAKLAGRSTYFCRKCQNVPTV